MGGSGSGCLVTTVRAVGRSGEAGNSLGSDEEGQLGGGYGNVGGRGGRSRAWGEKPLPLLARQGQQENLAGTTADREAS